MDPDPHSDVDADPDSSIFIIDLQDANNRTNFKKSFAAYYFLKVLLHHFSKVKSPKEGTKQQKSRFFLLFLLNDRRIRTRIQEAQKLVDPDPQHWTKPLFLS
jgi:hypothetical protein